MRRWPGAWFDVLCAVGAVACTVAACRTFSEVRPGEVHVELCETAARFVRSVTGHDSVTVPLPGGSIALLPPHASPELRCHEGVHAEQRDRLGLQGYAQAYVAGALANGYQGNPLEVEARERCPLPSPQP